MTFTGRSQRKSCLCLFGAAVAWAGLAPAQDVHLFSYFKNPDGLDGLHIAYSLDGFSWHAVNADQGLLAPLSGSLMRDPSISRTPDGVYHMVHTVSWGSTTNIGYAQSTDLINWTNQKYIPVMNGYSNIANVWAPELYYDAASNKHMIFWASGVNGVGHRIYMTKTSDFNTFEPTVKFYDPGFEVIDSFIVKDGDNHVMFVKDERQTGGHLYVFKAQGGSDAAGAYDTTTFPRVSGTGYAFEGPTATKIGDTWFVYGDRYGEGRMGLLTSSDGMQTWQDRVADIAFPGGTKHGTVFNAPRSILDNLIANAANATSQVEYDGLAGTGNLTDAGNWLGRELPGAGQTPIIQLGQSATLSQSLAGTFNEFWIGQTSAGTLAMAGGSLNMSGWLCVARNNGSAGSRFTQSGGTITTVNASMGSVGPTAEGSYTLSNNARLAIANNFYLGETGRGTFTQLNNASVTIGSLSLGRWASGAGTLDLQGGTLAISGNLYVAERGAGTIAQSGNSAMSVGGFMSVGLRGTALHTMNGGTLTVAGDFNVADIRGSRGTLNINSGTMILGSLFVGAGYNESGSSGISIGTVTQDGGLVRISRNSNRLIIGGRDTVNAAGHYTLNAGTLQTGTSNFFIGGYAAGTFTQNGGDVAADQWVSIGRFAGSSGRAILNGGTFRQTNGTTGVTVGELGAGTLIVAGTASVNLASGLRISTAGGTGRVFLTGGALATPNIADGGGTSSLQLSGGVLRATASTGTFLQGLDSAIISTGGGQIDSATFDITIAQALLHDPELGLVRDGGLSKLGAGTLTLTGNNSYTGHTTVSNGTLRFKPQAGGVFPVNNTNAGDVVINSGSAIFDYSVGGGNPSTTVHQLLTASANSAFQSGRIRTGNLPDAGMAIGWLDNGTSAVAMRYTFKGDLDLSGSVDSADFNAFVASYGLMGAIWAQGDFNYDGKVSTLDFNHLSGNFGLVLTPPAASLGSVVPEPSTVSITLLCVAGLARRRKA